MIPGGEGNSSLKMIFLVLINTAHQNCCSYVTFNLFLSRGVLGEGFITS